MTGRPLSGPPFSILPYTEIVGAEVKQMLTMEWNGELYRQVLLQAGAAGGSRPARQDYRADISTPPYGSMTAATGAVLEKNLYM